MNQISVVTIRYLCGALLLAGSFQCHAEDQAPAKPEVSNNEQGSNNEQASDANKTPGVDETNHIIIGNRRLSHVEHVKMQEASAEEAKKLELEALASGIELPRGASQKQDEDSNANLKSQIESKESRMASGTMGNKKAMHNAAIFYTSHAGAYHSPLSVSFTGDSIVLEDGSVWAASASDSYKTLNWLISDLIVITPNYSWFSVYNYVMTNQNTGAAVPVNIVLGPLYNSPYRHWIVAIDYSYDKVYLEDGSVWKMWDGPSSKKWMVGDTVVIGINDGWWSSSNPNILINCNVLNHARGICVY